MTLLLSQGRDMQRHDVLLRSIKVLVLGLALASIGGCSFHSNQWNALSSLWRSDGGPQKNWQVSWSDRVFNVFAINAGSEVIFADGDGFILRFDGWQVRQVEGVLPAQDTLYIDSEDQSNEDSLLLRFSGTASRFGEFRCKSWRLSTDLGQEIADQDATYEQKCETGTVPVKHSIVLNSDRQLLALSFTLHPAYPPADIRFIGD
jgi:hypothetical protein